MDSASKNASACVLSPPRGRKNCKTANKYLTALACKVGFSKGFWHIDLQICPPTCWLSLFLVYFLIQKWLRSHFVYLFMQVNPHVSFPVFLWPILES